MIKKNRLKTRHIVTGADANYLHKLLVFYRSLSKHHRHFMLHIFCFDDVAYGILKKLNYENVILYHTSEFETQELLKVKSSKQRRYEYYWTCNPFITLKVLDEQKTDFIASADCDLMFFDSPEAIFEEMDGADALIQPNNFSFQFEKDCLTVGYYCTSLQCFRKNNNGRNILNWWHKRCMEWCSSKFEDGKFGEQKYLDDWRLRFRNVSEVTNIGANVAPWNIQKFDLSKLDGRVLINGKWPIIYFHFHSFRMNLTDYKYIITGDRHNNYPISQEEIELIYNPYIKAIKESIRELKEFKDYRRYVKINPEGVQKNYD